MTCTHCAEGLDHCHGTLVLHSAFPFECSEPDCTDFGIVRHTLVVDCEEIDGGCSCSVIAQEAELLRVS